METATGALTLFDAATGLPLRALFDARLATSAFVAITPAGRALYQQGGKYLPINLHQSFAASPVQPAAGTANDFVP